MHSGRVSHHCMPCSEILREKMASEVTVNAQRHIFSKKWSSTTVGILLSRFSLVCVVCVYVYVFPHPLSSGDLFGTEMPSFLKTPMDLTIRTGAMARLECAAEGTLHPQISWQKDGGTDFPAARERRMHVMPEMMSSSLQM